MKRFFLMVTAHPWIVAGLFLAIAGAFAYALTSIRVDAKVENMMPEGHPSVDHARFVEDAFQVESSAVIAVENEGPEGIYSLHTLALVRDLTDKLAKVRGVDPQKIWSIYTVSNIVGNAGGFDVIPMCDRLPQTTQEAEELRRRVRANTMVYGTMVATSEKGTLIYAAVTPVADKAQVYHDIRALLRETPTEGETFYVTGDPVVEGVLGQYVNQDMGRMMPFVSVLVVVLLLVMFRNLRGLLLPLAGVVFCILGSLGIMSAAKIPLYPMTTMIPILLMAMGVAYGIHIIARYAIVAGEQRSTNPAITPREVTILAMLELWSPLVMAATTDAAGFLSLLASTMKPIFYTGVFTSVGLLLAMVFALAVIPAILGRLKLPARAAGPAHESTGGGFFGRFGLLVYRLRKGIAVGAVLMLGAMLILARGVIVESDPMANFNTDDPIPQSTRVINEMFGGSIIINTTLESDDEKRFLDPETLAAVDRFQEDVKAIPNVGAVAGVVDFLKLMHRAMNENDAAAFVVPPTRNLVGTYLMLYSGDNLNHFINYGADKLNVEIRVTSTSTRVLQEVLTRIEQTADRDLGGLSGVTVRTGGPARVVVDMLNIIIDGQIQSIFLSLLLVFIITSIMFRSPLAGVFTSLPIILATSINFGIMAALKIPLEPATAITSCIGIGVGVDYGIHLIAKYRIMYHRGFRGAALVESTMASAGKSIFFNAAVVIGGFLVLVTSVFPPTRHMGVMVSLNMFTSYLASVTLLPAALAWFDPAFCRRGLPGEAGA